MPVTASPPNTFSDATKQRAVASAVLQVAEKVPGDMSYIPFSWSVEHITADTANRRFVFTLVPEEDCRGFLFRAPHGSQAELLCEWAGRAESALRLPQAGELAWDGRDDSMLVIIAVGNAASNNTAIRRQTSPLRGSEPYHTSTGLLTLGIDILGLKGDDTAQRP